MVIFFKEEKRVSPELPIWSHLPMSVQSKFTPRTASALFYISYVLLLFLEFFKYFTYIYECVFLVLIYKYIYLALNTLRG